LFAHSLLGTEINCTTGAVLFSSHSGIGSVLYLLSLIFKNSKAVLASHNLILLCTAALATIFGNCFALSTLKAKSGFLFLWLMNEL
jgi:hypothetical protein